MKNRSRLIAAWAVLFVAASFGQSQKPAGTMAFTVSMDKPGKAIHVVFRCEGLRGATQDFKMPVWMPGFYRIIDFAKNVQNFRAEDGGGKPLQWEKIAGNAWRVQSGGAGAITVTYDVQTASRSVGGSYLEENRGLIGPTGVFMHVAGQIRRPVTVTFVPNPAWSTIATGLDPVPGDRPHTYAAPDFDILYDSPILMGNLESLPPFEIQGIPHYFFGYNLDVAEPEQFMNELKAAVEAGVAVIGDIPYKHYTFLAIGPTGGGIEHLNSTTFGFDGAALNTRKGRINVLRLLAHEYFHHYNVKRIRPRVLGPFDYDRANVTDMLWVSEGFTRYYNWVMLRRAGILTDEEFLDAFRIAIAAYENNTGHLFQSATQSSRDVWNPGAVSAGSSYTAPAPRQSPEAAAAGGNGIKKTISYYDKGNVLGLLLDFKIRHETRNRNSLDTVMRTLYQEYYRKKQRGWTDEEFRAVCEKTAGVPLAELFEYASTTREIDYAKYLAYAGLELEEPKELSEASLGAIAEDIDGKLIISALEGNSPAQRAGLAPQDLVQAVDGAAADARAFYEALGSKKPGDRIRLKVLRAGKDRQIDALLGHRMERSFRILPAANPDPLAAAIRKDWMKSK